MDRRRRRQQWRLAVKTVKIYGLSCRTWKEDKIWLAETIDHPVGADGDTKAEAIENLKACIRAHFNAPKVKGGPTRKDGYLR
jgi:hypothetical protein